MNGTDQPAQSTLPLAADRVGEAVVRGEDGVLSSYLDSINEHGGLFNYSEAGRLVGLTSQRIGQLVERGKLQPVRVEFRTMKGGIVVQEKLGGHALVKWFQSRNPKGGRPRTLPPAA